MALNSNNVTKLTSALSSLVSQRETFAYSAISRGMASLQNQNYARAVREFQMARAYSPDMAEIHIYLGRTYELMGQTDEAISAYKQAIRVDSSNTDAVEFLASLYMTNERYLEAQEQLKQLIRLDPTNADAVSSLGYAYLNNGETDEAEQQFMKAIRLAPRDPTTYYSLGLAYSRDGRFTDAISEFEAAINLDRNYAAAHAELGFAYLGLDEEDLARSELKTLRGINTAESNEYADQLASALYTPKILISDSLRSTFDCHLGAGTALSDLDSRLATPGATVTFSMTFLFNRQMDVASVQNVANWWISKATGGKGGVYNNGATGSVGNEISISPMPTAVRYDPSTYRATVYFTITQNATGTGVIDPSHWVFRFKGVDTNGTPMDRRGDEYDGAGWGGF